MKKVFFILFYITVNSFSIFCQTCKELPNKFTSYKNAIQIIKKTNFKFVDKLQSSKSSWITSATFYSYDSFVGYLVYKTAKGNEYVHERVPIQVWTEFKTASSSGSYYVQNMKDKYRLVPE